MKKRVFFGIDPGKDGYITAYDGKEFKFYAMPIHDVETGVILKSGKAQTKPVFNEKGFQKLIDQINVDYLFYEKTFAIEEVIGRQGWSAQNNFNFGFTAGLQRMIPIMLGANYITVRPQKWQSYVRQGYPDIKKPSSTGKTQVNDTKAIAEMIVLKEFPDIDFRKTEKAKKNHDGKIDSFLICMYLYRILNKQ